MVPPILLDVDNCSLDREDLNVSLAQKVKRSARAFVCDEIYSAVPLVNLVPNRQGTSKSAVTYQG